MSTIGSSGYGVQTSRRSYSLLCAVHPHGPLLVQDFHRSPKTVLRETPIFRAISEMDSPLLRVPSIVLRKFSQPSA